MTQLITEYISKDRIGHKRCTIDDNNIPSIFVLDNPVINKACEDEFSKFLLEEAVCIKTDPDYKRYHSDENIKLQIKNRLSVESVQPLNDFMFYRPKDCKEWLTIFLLDEQLRELTDVRKSTINN